MTPSEIEALYQKQRTFFSSGATLDVAYRISALKKLRQAIVENETAIAQALREDLGKSAEESYMCETGMVISEISYLLQHIRRYARERTVLTPLAQFAARSCRKPTPYGVCLIMSPWNYPLLLTLDPLADALAAGNTVILKPSAYSPATSVGRLVLEKAAPHLTPVTLELGGKSPCIVDRSAKISLAARRIVFGKFLNCGQTCVAPDYILCHESVKDELIGCLKAEIQKQYGADPLKNAAYGKIISQKHFSRVSGLMDERKVVWGGETDPAALKIAPTLMADVTWEDAVMGEEIFGPVLPILTFRQTQEVLDTVQAHDTPLALYVFAEDKAFIRTVTDRCAFGGGCVNDCIIHLATSRMGFGGMGESGMGAYHGKIGFDTFTHYKSIVDKKTWLDLPMRYQPYQKIYNRLVRLFLR